MCDGGITHSLAVAFIGEKQPLSRICGSALGFLIIIFFMFLDWSSLLSAPIRKMVTISQPLTVSVLWLTFLVSSTQVLPVVGPFLSPGEKPPPKYPSACWFLLSSPSGTSLHGVHLSHSLNEAGLNPLERLAKVIPSPKRPGYWGCSCSLDATTGRLLHSSGELGEVHEARYTSFWTCLPG